MSHSVHEQVESAIHDFVDPYSGDKLFQLHALRDLQVDDGHVRAEVRLGYPTTRAGQGLAAELEQLVESLPGVASAVIRVSGKIVPHAVPHSASRIDAIQNVIAIASAKGGVGKSTVSANLALALAAEGARVGMLDADIYGPSQPRMLGVSGQPRTLDGKNFEPMWAHGVQSMSIGYMVGEDQPMVWRGPMVTKALKELLHYTNWQPIDYLIVDMPPGTGDVQLTMGQQVPLSGAVMVTTPQDIATLDARKGLEMFRKVDVPVLGIVENMSQHVCSNCGHEEHTFGEGGGERVARDYGVPLLGALPLDVRIREHADGGRPSVIAEPDGAVARRYREIALRMSASLARQPKDYSRKFPKVVVKSR